jgi:hypothetical protein
MQHWEVHGKQALYHWTIFPVLRNCFPNTIMAFKFSLSRFWFCTQKKKKLCVGVFLRYFLEQLIKVLLDYESRFCYICLDSCSQNYKSNS